MKSLGHFIDGAWVEGKGPWFHSTDPSTEETVWTGGSATPEDLRGAVDAAGRAFDEWAQRDIFERIHYLEAFGKELTSGLKEMAEAICLETGKPEWEAVSEVKSMIGKIQVSVDAYNDRCGTRVGEMDGARMTGRFRPHGPIAVLGPFNLPGHLPNGHIVPALLAGNTIVFKPSSQTPLVGETMVRMWRAAGLPKGVVNLIQGGRGMGTELVTDPGLAGVFFTGGVDTGRAIHRVLGGSPEKILALEMGGNNPLIVHEASDPLAAARLTILSAFITSGQRCSCARRLIVTRGPAGDEFLSALRASIEKIRVGAWTDDPEPFMGPVISRRAADGILAAQERLKNMGGHVLVELRAKGHAGFFLTPGLMDVTRVRLREDEEIFGPLLQLIRTPDLDSALTEANNTAYGLAAGLLCDDPAAYDLFLRRVRVGVANWNRQTTGASARLPFGGVGLSGNHRPSGYFAADYCSYPVASIESEKLADPVSLPPGLE